MNLNLNLRAPPPAITLPSNSASMSTNNVAGASMNQGQAGEGGKPGGTARGGTKTPRKVQWATVVHDDGKKGPLESGPGTGQQQSTHALDEQGLDVSAFFLLFRCCVRGLRGLGVQAFVRFLGAVIAYRIPHTVPLVPRLCLT